MRVLIWHWGRRGGGPKYTLELVQEMAKMEGVEAHLSLSKQSEIYAEFSHLDLPGWHIDTYNGMGSALLGLLRLPFIRYAFWRYYEVPPINSLPRVTYN